MKGTVVADGARRPLWFEANPPGEGRTHDVTMLRAQTGLLAVFAATTATVLADKAYVGFRHDIDPAGVLTPWVKPRGGTLSVEDRDANHLLSSLRMPVEHAIGRIKWWRAIATGGDPPTASTEAAKPSPSSPPCSDRAPPRPMHRRGPTTIRPRIFRPAWHLDAARGCDRRASRIRTHGKLSGRARPPRRPRR